MPSVSRAPRDDIRTGLRIIGFERRVSIAFHVETATVVINRILYGGRDVEKAFQERADQTGRKTSNLSRTLRTMAHYGFVELYRGERGRIRPEVPYQAISLVLPFTHEELRP